MLRLLAKLGALILDWLAACGQFGVFAWRTVVWIFVGAPQPRNWALLPPQMYMIGTLSVPVIMVTGTFVGFVLAAEAIVQLKAVGLGDRIGVLVNLAVVRELGPVLAGTMLAGRVGGALSAELGTMNVTEQIDALRAMGSDPIRYLVAPRFLACVLLTPFLTLYCDVMGALGGWLISVKIFRLQSDPYWVYTQQAIENWDLYTGLAKSVFFGAAIGLISCYKGFTCGHGAEGVGRACTQSFVASFMSILLIDFVLILIFQETYEMIWGVKPLL
ncbi:MAG: ABC transporter permease [Phycisphaerae bacterium]|nr:ABC transporter permease [Phycisphaerae bacterium]